MHTCKICTVAAKAAGKFASAPFPAHTDLLRHMLDEHPAEMDAMGETLTKQLADAGLVVEGGWAGFIRACGIAKAGTHQLRDMRMAFFAGGMHVFTSMLTFIERGGDEPTQNDMKRMALMSEELERFEKGFKELITRSTNRN